MAYLSLITGRRENPAPAIGRKIAWEPELTLRENRMAASGSRNPSLGAKQVRTRVSSFKFEACSGRGEYPAAITGNRPKAYISVSSLQAVLGSQEKP